MPGFVLPLVLAVLSLAGATTAHAQSRNLPDPLGLHGFNLGMTLAEVRGQKFPGPAATRASLAIHWPHSSASNVSTLYSNARWKRQVGWALAVMAERKRRTGSARLIVVRSLIVKCPPES